MMDGMKNKEGRRETQDRNKRRTSISSLHVTPHPRTARTRTEDHVKLIRASMIRLAGLVHLRIGLSQRVQLLAQREQVAAALILEGSQLTFGLDRSLLQLTVGGHLDELRYTQVLISTYHTKYITCTDKTLDFPQQVKTRHIKTTM